jgi:hypothetical protein
VNKVRFSVATSRLLSIFLLLMNMQIVSAVSHVHEGHKVNMSTLANGENKCVQGEAHVTQSMCAQTLTSAFAPNGDLWRLWSQESALYFDISTDKGNTFSPRKKIASVVEKISSRNENRPKIAFDGYQGVYLSWATPRSKKYSADVRFSYSDNYGKTFSSPITVNDDNLLTGHSFNEMHVNEEGDISIVWLDSRLAYQQRKQGKSPKGSSLYLATANVRKTLSSHVKTNPLTANNPPEIVFNNQSLANNTCVCCRIAMDVTAKDELAILWRHIYGDNIREFALLTLTAPLAAEGLNVLTSRVPYQISFDHWKINGCPHQGGGISIDEKNRYHMVWFNQGDKGKGIFYAFSDNAGRSLSTPLSIGDFSAQAIHPHVSVLGESVDLVWTQFTGDYHQLWHQSSIDSGKSFTKAKLLSQSDKGSDRPFIITDGKTRFVSWQRPQQEHWFQAL